MRLFGMFRDGEIDRPTFVQSAARAVVAAQDQAAILGAAAVRAHVEVATGEPQVITPPSPRPESEEKRITDAFESVLDDPNVDAWAKRVERITRSEPARIMQEAQEAAMFDNEAVVGYRRQLDENPCPKCVALARGGAVIPLGEFNAHPNCECLMIPVLRDREGREYDATEIYE